MSKADEMNLVEAISLLKEMKDNALIACRFYKTGGVLYRDEKAEKKVNAIETVLNYIDNSISKEVIDRERIEQRTKLLYCNRAKNKAILDKDKEEIERQERLINILKVNIKSLEDILYERVNK